MTAIYGTEEAAFRRVDTIRRTFGAWPGVRTRSDRAYDLTYDPGTLLDAGDDLGRFSELGFKAGGERRWPQAAGRTAGLNATRNWAKPPPADRVLP